MDQSHETDLLKMTERSGFPFQIGVRGEIERTWSEHRWSVVAEEHPWTHPISGKGGFIDLIVEHEEDGSPLHLVIECKRLTPKTNHSGEVAKWVFLTPSDYTTTEHRLSGFVTEQLHHPWKAEWIDDLKCGPPTLESSYCLFESQDEKHPMVERIADSLLPSVEAVGHEWLNFSDIYGENRLFLPVIVTNASLYTCTFAAEDVSMASGHLADGVFHEVPFIRFRKGLAQERLPQFKARNFSEANRKKQRTLLIINAASLTGTLQLLRRSS